jgi:hypothetical protein
MIQAHGNLGRGAGHQTGASFPVVDMLIQSQISPSENKGNEDLHSAKRDQTRQNTHTGRTRKDEGGL